MNTMSTIVIFAPNVPEVMEWRIKRKEKPDLDLVTGEIYKQGLHSTYLNLAKLWKQVVQIPTGGGDFTPPEDFPPEKETPVRFLEALNIIIARKDLVDLDALKPLKIPYWQNVRFRLISPIFQQASSDTAPYTHQEMINLQVPRSKGLTGKRVLIGVLDSGIMHDHPVFAGKKIADNANGYFAEFNEWGTLISTNAHDSHGHGTVSASIAAALSPLGIAPDAELAVARVLTQHVAEGGIEGTAEQVLAGLNWLLSNRFSGRPIHMMNGVDLVNASLTLKDPDGSLHTRFHGTPGTSVKPIIAAIGNNGLDGINNHGSPGNFGEVLGVGFVSENGCVNSYSDWGAAPQYGSNRKPDLCAPGVNVQAATIKPENRPGYTTAVTGTSVAAPIVTGAAALVMEADPSIKMNPPLLFAKLKELTQSVNTACNVPNDGGHGILDLTNI